MKFILQNLYIATLLMLVGLTSHAQSMANDSIIIKKWTIKNCVNQFNPEQTITNPVGYQYWFADKNFIDGRTLKMSVVAPHQATHSPHKHAEDEFFFILEGQALFILNGDSVAAEPYASFYCPSGVEHGIRNIGDTELKYLVIKKYQQ